MDAAGAGFEAIGIELEYWDIGDMLEVELVVGTVLVLEVVAAGV